mgnify:CR=1 FL=1
MAKKLEDGIVYIKIIKLFNKCNNRIRRALSQSGGGSYVIIDRFSFGIKQGKWIELIDEFS